MKESLSVRFLYQTIIGRAVLKILINPSISKASAKVLSLHTSSVVVPFFVKKNNIDMNQYEVPLGGYRSFNDFFIRKRKKGLIRIAGAELVCPSDGLLTIKSIGEDTVFDIKNSRYLLADLLENSDLAAEYEGGTALIFRLTPSHYHRYVYCANGITSVYKRIEGVLHCVRPIAIENIPVFTRNSREYQVIHNEKLGDIIQMEVGALLVGKITNKNNDSGRSVIRGDEKGFFEYGGSTIIVLVKQGVEVCDSIRNRRTIDGEIPVIVGEALV